MKYYGKSEDAAMKILKLFESGNVPKAIAPIFVRRHDNLPCRSWSWSNRLLTALADTNDARGFRQWLDAGRVVKKGAKSFQILGPVSKKITVRDGETGDESERVAVVGFKSIPVFRLEDTDVVDSEKWESVNKPAIGESQWVDALPLVEVARSWGLKVDTFNARQGGAMGWYHHGTAIELGVRNLSTWTHELVHAADDKNGKLTKGGRGQKLDNEVVAELGGSILLTLLGDNSAADYGGCWEYISSYANRHKVPPVRICEQLLSRTCEAVNLILQTADVLNTVNVETGKGVAA